jgi:putative ABC transport system permease protein
MALREIRRHTMRSALTTLGIVIGVAAVVALVTIGRATTTKVTADVGKMGNNLLTVMPGAERRGPMSSEARPFTTADVKAIRREISSVSGVAPVVNAMALVVAGNNNRNTSVTGTWSDFTTVRGYDLETGRLFTEGEENSSASVCVLGATVKNELFGGQDPVGQSLRVGSISCSVIGTLEAKGQGSFGADQDDIVLMPLRTVQRRIRGSDDVNSIAVSAASDAAIPRVKAQLEALMKERRRITAGKTPDFNVRDMKEIAETMSSITGTMTALLAAIAAVSLLVGGIGIMNIMLVSVTERTREIGIRLAIGAQAHEVLLQFLLEAVALSLLGGLAGVVIGLGGSFAAMAALDLPLTFAPEIIALAFGFSALVGVGFGYFPARKAARLHPIEALRYE